MPIIQLPGPVEIDECHISARVRGSHGRIPSPGSIVFGIKCRTTKLTLLFPVPDKKKETLHPIILDHVQEGAEVISDKFSSYITRRGRSHLDELGYEHYFINHSVEFVDPIQNFIHTNNIERTWRSLRASISHIKRSISQDKIQSFIDSFHFYSFFSQDSLYDVLLQIILTLNVI